MTLSPAQEAALVLLQAMLDAKPALEAAHTALKALYRDFAGQPVLLPDPIEAPVMALMDAVLGEDGIASYFLYECQFMGGGGKIVEGEREWKIQTVADLRAYLEREPVA